MRGTARSGLPAPTRGLPRVLVVSSHATDGGSERVLLELLAALPAGVATTVVALQDGPLVARLAERGIAADVLPVGGSPASLLVGAARLARRLRRRGHDRPTVVHANGVKAAVVAALATRLAAPGRPVPVVWMKHDVSLDGAVGRGVARSVHHVVCVSDEVRHAVSGAGSSSVVRPGLHVDRQAAASAGASLRAELGLHGPVVSVVGRLDPAKGHGELLAALPEIDAVVTPPRRPQLLLVGPDVPEHPGIRAGLTGAAAAYGTRVHVLAARPAAAVIAASDVVCVPTVPRPDGSGREGYGLVAAEALALGVPVVAYDVGASREVLGDAGTLVPPGDRTALAAAVAGLLGDPAAHRRAAGLGLARAAGRGPAATATALLSVYRDATGGPS